MSIGLFSLPSQAGWCQQNTHSPAPRTEQKQVEPAARQHNCIFEANVLTLGFFFQFVVWEGNVASFFFPQQ